MEPANLPIGLIAGTPIHKQLFSSDRMTCWFSIPTVLPNPRMMRGGYSTPTKGFLELVQRVPVASASDTGQRLLAGLEAFRGASPAADDETLVVLQRRESADGPDWPH
jgi:hypothetical protein